MSASDSQQQQEPDITFESLSPHSTTAHMGHCHLLRVGKITMLLDCGVDESYSQGNLDTIVKALKRERVEYILISHAAIT
jgi:Cft2 family RNA processing exonuclease